MAFPDPVAALIAYLDPLLTGPVASRVPDPRPVLFTQVRRVGGAAERPVRDRPRIDIRNWAATEPEAMAQALESRRLMWALRGTTTLGFVVYKIEETLGPLQIDDPLTSSNQVLATYSLLIRADEAI